MLSRLPIRMFSRAFIPRLHTLPIVARALWRKHAGIRKDLKRTDGFSSKPPYQISLRITNRCNQRCAICGQFGEKGYMKDSKDSPLLSELSFEDYRKIVDETAHYKPVFYITGGEALLYKDLFKLTEYMKQKGCYVYVITNGALLEKYAPEIVCQQWDMLTCSLDGPEAIHDQCRGVPGTFSKTVKGVRRLLDERKGKRDPYFLISATVSSANQDHLPEMFDVVEDLKPDGLILYLSWFTTEELGRAHAGILKKELDVDAVTWQSYIGQNVSIHSEKLRETLQRTAKMKYSFDWFHIPFIPFDKIDRYYQEPSDFLGYGPCVSTYLMADIMPNGDVVTCRDYIDVKVGNITEAPLLEIWNAQGFRGFRKLLKKNGGTLPQCSRCCSLMGF